MTRAEEITKRVVGAMQQDNDCGTGLDLAAMSDLSGNSITGESAESGSEISLAHGMTSPNRGTVLLAEDEHFVREVCAEMLGELGFRVITAGDGVEAVEIFRSHSDTIDCVVLDVTMPRMDGLTALNEILKVRSDAKVILSSGGPAEEIAQDIKGPQPAGILTKPFAIQDLEEQMGRIFGDRK